MDKNQKIALIKGLISGEIKLDDLKYKKLVLEIYGDQTPPLTTINGEPVSSEEFHAVWERQFDRDGDNSSWYDVIIDGVSINDPDYLVKSQEIWKKTYTFREIGPNNWVGEKITDDKKADPKTKN